MVGQPGPHRTLLSRALLHLSGLGLTPSTTPTSPPLRCSTAKTAAAEKAFWAGQQSRRAEASKEDLALGKLEEMAWREDRVREAGQAWRVCGTRV